MLNSFPRGAVPTAAMSSSDRLTRKTHPLESNTESLDVIQPKLYRLERLPAPPHVPREQTVSAVNGGTPKCMVWTS